YAGRKNWGLPQVNVTIDLITEEGKTIFSRKIELHGDLDEDQTKRLLSVANACPLHKILSHSIEINTELSY
ncbi:MAG TPA: hypothetical protein DIT07_03520, partial [Sphingobacteriaceae bacterium]|nr:hypothetical protein [Sphingobacteriaceae bacterium]